MALKYIRKVCAQLAVPSRTVIEAVIEMGCPRIADLKAIRLKAIQMEEAWQRPPAPGYCPSGHREMPEGDRNLLAVNRRPAPGPHEIHNQRDYW